MESERRKFGMILVFAVLFATLTLISVGCASATTHYVNPDKSIQAAVDAADPGDTIIVMDGTYTENIVIKKSMTIKSENGPTNCIVNAKSAYNHVFEVESDHVTIEGFAIEGATGIGHAGIYLKTNHSNVSNNICSNSWDGILLFFSNNNSMLNNICSNNQWVGIELNFSSKNVILSSSSSNNGLGIGLTESSNENIISNNSCSNNEQGILLDYSNKNIISNNSYSNNKNGILLDSSNKNIISNNSCSNNKWGGIHLFKYSNNNIISNNICSNNGGGIGLLFSSENNIMSNNSCSNNEIGIALDEYSNNNIISNNSYSNNKYGIGLTNNSNNFIYLNNFMWNKRNVLSYNSTNIWRSPAPITYTYEGKEYTNYLGNYWGDYKGKDENSDGIGDTLYIIDEDNEDSYPLIKPTTPTSKPSADIPREEAIIAIAGVLLVVAAYLLRRRK
uniref:Cell surface glycoprotein n=1 Tax=Candidatus Methanophaga sp. ANME-1 ERB7 TaxID=2759913 RepID=A0A7G9Z212_9EURY|nr:cell surface glycoprotein [Methanosarcinales archaeon ANME-1 ERB7]